MKAVTKKRIFTGLKVALVLGGAYAIYRLTNDRNMYKALYKTESAFYVDLARKCGIAQSGDHRAIAKTIFKDGSEFLASSVTKEVTIN